MNARNFDKLMQEQIETSRGSRLLLHCCCAPCSSACLERLKDDFDITVLFYNPNIEEPEYTRRKDELMRLIDVIGGVKYIDADHDCAEFYDAVRGLENEREGGARCMQCFKLRLAKTADVARDNGFDFFTTTLTISPLKNAAAINCIGESMQKGVKWLYCDFKKRDGYLRSLQISEKLGLYRQNYCGCVFSRDKSIEKK